MKIIKPTMPVLFIVCIYLYVPLLLYGQGHVIKRKAKNTLTPVEMHKGDTLEFKLRNGEIRTLVLKETSVRVLITNLYQLKHDQPGGGLLYEMSCIVVVDGHAMKMIRYVGCQASFYVPYVIDGMRIWFDGVSDITRILKDTHGGMVNGTKTTNVGSCGCVPHKDARFAVTDMTNEIAPIELHAIYNPYDFNGAYQIHYNMDSLHKNTAYQSKENYIDVADAYDADDPFLGAYNGTEIHGGLDIAQPDGTPNYTPFPIDDQYLLDDLAKGNENNRWIGYHKWKDGDTWQIVELHMLNLLFPQHKSIKEGIHFADAAGVHVGKHHHAHYCFLVKTPKDMHPIYLDYWILFWQTFESSKKRAGKINAHIKPLSPHKTGELIEFKSEGSRSGITTDGALSYYWTFGDGGWSNEKDPRHIYVNPGIYPVTLVVDDGSSKATFTQDITISGKKINEPTLTLMAQNVPSFRVRSPSIMDIYGKPVQFIPHSLHFYARDTRPIPEKKVILIENNGGGVLSKVKSPNIFYLKGKGWLSIQCEGTGNNQKLIVGVDAHGLTTGIYMAKVQIKCEGAVNNNQGFIVQLRIPIFPPANKYMGNVGEVVIDQSNRMFNRFYCTPYFWVRPQFKRWIAKGYGDNFYFTNGGRAKKGEYARFRPDLEAGTYKVSFAKETPFNPERRAMSNQGQQPINPKLNPASRFAVRVHSAEGTKKIWVDPAKSKVIGTFKFSEGMDGYVDILAAASTGQVLVDAIIFKKIR